MVRTQRGYRDITKEGPPPDVESLMDQAEEAEAKEKAEAAERKRQIELEEAEFAAAAAEAEERARKGGKRPALTRRASGLRPPLPRRASGPQPAPAAVDFYRPVFDGMWEAFGEDRLVFGSNWPVSERAGDYKRCVDIVKAYFGEKGEAASNKYFSANSKAAYRWPDPA